MKMVRSEDLKIDRSEAKEKETQKAIDLNLASKLINNSTISKFTKNFVRHLLPPL